MPAYECNCTVYTSLLVFVCVWAHLWWCVFEYDCVFPQHMVGNHSSHTGSEPWTVGWIVSVFHTTHNIYFFGNFRPLCQCMHLCLYSMIILTPHSLSLRAVRSWHVSMLGSLPRSSSTSWVTPKGDSRGKVSAALLVRHREEGTDRLGLMADGSHKTSWWCRVTDLVRLS